MTKNSQVVRYKNFQFIQSFQSHRQKCIFIWVRKVNIVQIPNYSYKSLDLCLSGDVQKRLLFGKKKPPKQTKKRAQNS